MESARWRLDVGLGINLRRLAPAHSLWIRDPEQRRRAIVWNKIKAAFGRLWRPGRRRRTGEHGFQDQGEARRYRAQQIGEEARGQSYQPPPGPTPM